LENNGTTSTRLASSQIVVVAASTVLIANQNVEAGQLSCREACHRKISNAILLSGIIAGKP